MAGVSASCSGLKPGGLARAEHVVAPADRADEQLGAAVLVEEDDPRAANLRAWASRKFSTTVLPEPDGPMTVKLPRSPLWKLK